MERPLSEHIARLTEKIIVLKRHLRAHDLPPYQRPEGELALSNAEQALGLFRWAHEVEQKVSNRESI